MLDKLGLKWNSVEVSGIKVYYEENNNKTHIPYKLWDQEISVLQTASVCLAGDEEPASIEDWNDWLKDPAADNFDIELEFNFKASEFGSALRAEFNSFDQFTMVLVLDRSKKYWILATFDDIENEGFIMEAFLPNENLSMEEAFPYLMALFHLNYYNIIAGKDEGDEGDFDFEEAINSCNIIEGISGDAQEKSREFVTELYNKIKDDPEFWKIF